MTDPTPEGGVAVVDPPATGESPRRGRPRPSNTVERDERIYEMLTSPMSKTALVTASGAKPSEVYLSLWRLTRDGRVERTRLDGKHVWQRVGVVAA